MKKIHTFEQGSREWYECRLGIPTASQFHRIVTPTGKLSAQSRGYLCRLLCERLLKQSQDDQLGNIQWVERGIQEQPNAVRQFSFQTDLEVEPVGFITNGRIGASPDGLIKGRNRGLECKCPAPSTHLEYLLYGIKDDHRPQLQGQILVGEFECVHFYSYHPQMPPLHLASHPDPVFLPLLRGALNEFCDNLDTLELRARALGAYVVPISFQAPVDLAYGAEAENPLKVVIP